MDRGKTVYPPPPPGSGGITIFIKMILTVWPRLPVNSKIGDGIL